MKIAVRAPNWIGDGVMALPTIRALPALYPGSRVHVVSKRYLADVFRDLPGIEGVLPLPDRLSVRALVASARLLRKEGFDLGILLTNSFASALLFKLARIPDIAGYSRDGRGLLLSRRVFPPSVGGHHIGYYLHLLARLTGRESLPEHHPELALGEGEREAARAQLATLGIPRGAPLVGVAPAAAFGGAKCWPRERYGEWMLRWQARHPQAHFLLFGAAGERESIEAMLRPHSLLSAHNLAGRLALREAIAALSCCQLAVANDSGIMHLASALGIPLVAIFGPTLPQRTGPRSPRQRVLFHPAECTPCNYRECPTDQRCLTAVGVDEVMAACQALAESEGPPAGSRYPAG